MGEIDHLRDLGIELRHELDVYNRRITAAKNALDMAFHPCEAGGDIDRNLQFIVSVVNAYMLHPNAEPAGSGQDYFIAPRIERASDNDEPSNDPRDYLVDVMRSTETTRLKLGNYTLNLVEVEHFAMRNDASLAGITKFSDAFEKSPLVFPASEVGIFIDYPVAGATEIKQERAQLVVGRPAPEAVDKVANVLLEMPGAVWRD